MSDASDSQNVSSSEPYAGDANNLETGPVERASASGSGNSPHLIDEEEEEEGGKDEGEGEDEEQVVALTTRVKRASGKKNAKNEKKTKKEILPVVGAVNVTVDSVVGTTWCIMTAPKLEALRVRYNIP